MVRALGVFEIGEQWTVDPPAAHDSIPVDG